MKTSSIIGWLSILAVGFVVALVLFEPFYIGDTTVSIGSDAKSLLKRFGTPDGATEVSDISGYGPDGPMPEIAVRSFTLVGTVQTAQNFYRERCKTASLGLPGEDILKLDPAVICERIDESGTLSVFLYTSCTPPVCNVSIEVRHHVAEGSGL